MMCGSSTHTGWPQHLAQLWVSSKHAWNTSWATTGDGWSLENQWSSGCLRRVPLHSLLYHHFPIKCTVCMFKHLSFDLFPRPVHTVLIWALPPSLFWWNGQQYFEYKIPTLTGLREPIFNFSQVLLDKCAWKMAMNFAAPEALEKKIGCPLSS